MMSKRQHRPKVDLYLQIRETDRIGDKVSLKFDRVPEPVSGAEKNIVINYKDSNMIADVNIHVYFPRKLPLRAEDLFQLAIKFAREVINHDEGLLTQITGGKKLEDKPLSSFARGIKKTAETGFRASSLVPVGDLQMDGGIANFTGILYSVTLPGFPFQVASLPIVTTWLGVERPFDLTVRVVEPNGKVNSLASERVEPTNPWGYRCHHISLQFLLSRPGIYSLELLAGNKLQLRRPIEFRGPNSERTQTRHTPSLDMCLVAQWVTNVSDEAKIEVRNLMGDSGVPAGGPIGFLLGWSHCLKELDIQYQILDTFMRPVMEPGFYKLAAREKSTGLEHSVRRIHLGFDSLPFGAEGIYWLRVLYSEQERQFPFFLRT